MELIISVECNIFVAVKPIRFLLWLLCSDRHPGGCGQCTSAVHPLKSEVAQACALSRRWDFLEFLNWRGRGEILQEYFSAWAADLQLHVS